MTQRIETRMTTVELTLATLISENHAIHERLESRVQTLEDQHDYDLEKIEELSARIQNEVESFRRMIVDLRKYTDQSDLVLEGRFDTLVIGLEGIREDCGL